MNETSCDDDDGDDDDDEDISKEVSFTDLERSRRNFVRRYGVA